VSGFFLGEFLGTLVLILFGGGVVAAVLLEKSKAKGAGWIVITAGWAFAVTFGIFTAKAFGANGELNPVGPLAAIVQGKGSVTDNLAMIAGEFLGAFCGATLVWLHYLPHWAETPDQGAKLAVFCTGPAIRDPMSNLFGEMLGTFMLVFVASAVGQARLGDLSPAVVGMVVWAIGLSLGATTGYAINPARDLAPRLAHALLPIAGKGDSDWRYAWVPVVGPCVGGVLGALAFRALS
jgi:glycerol uptake facilitator protein